MLKAPIEIATAPSNGVHRPAGNRDRSQSTGFSSLIDDTTRAEAPAPKSAEARPSRQTSSVREPASGTRDTTSRLQSDSTAQPNDNAAAASDSKKSGDVTANATAPPALKFPLPVVVGDIPKDEDTKKGDPTSLTTDVATTAVVVPDITSGADAPSASPEANIAGPVPQMLALPVAANLPGPTLIAAEQPNVVEGTSTSPPASTVVSRTAAPVKTLATAAAAETDDLSKPETAAASLSESAPSGALPKASPKLARTAPQSEKKLDAPVEKQQPETGVAAVAVKDVRSSADIAPAAITAADDTSAGPQAKPKEALASEPASPAPSPTATRVETIARSVASDSAPPNIPLPPAPPLLHTASAISPAAHLTATIASDVPVPLNGLAVEIATRNISGASSFAIRLDPADLGRIDVRLDVDKHGQVTSHLTVEKPETLAMLRQDAPQLQRALNDAGLKTSDSALQFSLGDQASAQQHADRGGERQPHRLIVQADDNIVAVPPQLRGYGRMIGARSGIDIRV